MKKLAGIFTILLSLGFLTGCDDNTGNLGLGTLDPDEFPNVKSEIYEITTSSVLADSVYAKTRIAYLGKISEPLFGGYECDFLTEFKCLDDYEMLRWHDIVPVEINGTDSIRKVKNISLHFSYDTFFGDSTKANRLSIYPLNDKLHNEKEISRYTNFNISQFHDPVPLAQAAYMVYDPEWDPQNYRSLDFRLPDQLGNDIFDKYENNREYFKNEDSFIENVFPGVYVKTDMGDGTILYINFIELRLTADVYVRDSVGGVLKRKQEGFEEQDSIAYDQRVATFASTREVFQTSRFTNSAELKERAKEKEHTYLKAPSGIFTTFSIPYDEINERHAGDTLNSVKVTFDTYTNKKAGIYSMATPSTMLLIRKSEMYSFFEKNELADGITSFTTTHNSSTNQYKFDNLLPLVKASLQEKEDARKAAGANWNEEAWMKENPDWDQVVLIPVTISVDSRNNVIGISHNLKPEYVKLKGGDSEKIKLSVVSTRKEK